jgi:hypothetical protein
MSADNWAKCPKCQDILNKAFTSKTERIKNLYGKVSAEEYNLKVRAIEAEAETPINDTLREDYVICINSDGEFHVNYGGSCEVCGFHFHYQHEEKVLKP